MATVSGAALLLTPGIALAQDDDSPPCDSRATYPPGGCEPSEGGAGNEAPPLQVNTNSQDDSVFVQSSGCAPGAAVVIGLARMNTPAQHFSLGQATSDDLGAYSATVTLPADVPDGVYVMYGECSSGTSNDTIVNTTSFVVQAGKSAALRSNSNSNSSSSNSSSNSSSGNSSSVSGSGITAADLPAAFTPSAGWFASPEKQAAITEAINLRLAAMKAALPVLAADTTAAPAAVADPADYTPWYAAAGVGAVLLLGAAGWRRRAIVGNDTNSEASA